MVKQLKKKSANVYPKICLPIKLKPYGGVYTFLGNFINFLEANNITYTDNIDSNYEVLFVNSWMVPYSLVRQAKQRLKEVKVVQRIDGSARDYGRTDNADNKQSRVSTLADLIIFQSRYSWYATTQKYKVICQTGPIIYNLVDVRTFRPDGVRMKLPGKIKICYVSFSTNPRKGAAALYEVAKQNHDLDFILVGNYSNVPDISNIHLMGQVDRISLARILRSCDLFLFFSENEACPNVVLEAMASGLPVLYKDSGATLELVADAGLITNINDFRAQFEAAWESRRRLSKIARDRCLKNFSSQTVFTKYLDEIIAAKRQSLPSYMDFAKSALAGYPVITPVMYTVNRVIRKSRRLLGANIKSGS